MAPLPLRTWALVMIKPLGSIKNPEPPLMSLAFSGTFDFTSFKRWP
jgi:hypothetical protein